MITINCDCCKKQLSESKLIRLGTMSEDLQFVNKTNEGQNSVLELNNYVDLHFCGKTCFVEYFFGNETNTKI